MRDTLLQGLPALGLDPALTARLEAFASLLLERNRVMNLTAITEPGAVASLHLLDSLTLAPLLGPGPGSVVDVGTGAGFPGVPLAIALPEKRFTLLDSLGKRVAFLEEAAGTLALQCAMRQRPGGGVRRGGAGALRFRRQPGRCRSAGAV